MLPRIEGKGIPIGVVGVGHLGFHHARILKKTPGAELIGIADTNPSRLQWVSRKLGCRAFSSPEELLGRVKAVTICVPTASHHAASLPFLKAGVHTFIEKPITRDLKEADDLIREARAMNVLLEVGHVERFNQAVQALAQYPGRVYFIECHRLSPFKKRSLDIGVTLDLMIHDIDIILGLIPSPLVSIEAVGARVLTQQEDIANARLRFENGCIANITTSRLTHRAMRKIRIFQENCYISIDYARQAAAVYHKESNRIVSRKIRIRRREPLRLELAHFVSEVAQHNGVPRGAGAVDTKARDALATAIEITRQIAQAPHTAA
ncbi:MAG: Gfo/Idh/MocA family oxidoreductase [Candidatus Omnitrophica bacterium]|nr:Gfo/Idh/MocA family oxidoreductase [Candidatus Omnitrophota bacterium]